MHTSRLSHAQGYVKPINEIFLLNNTFQFANKMFHFVNTTFLSQILHSKTLKACHLLANNSKEIFKMLKNKHIILQKRHSSIAHVAKIATTPNEPNFATTCTLQSLHMISVTTKSRKLLQWEKKNFRCLTTLLAISCELETQGFVTT